MNQAVLAVLDSRRTTDRRAAGELFKKGAADFSVHAFRDDLLLHDPGWTACRSMSHKPQFAEGAFKGFTMDHETGEEFSDEAVARHFRGRDVVFAGREEAGAVVKRLFHSRLARLWAEKDRLTCELTGDTDGPSPLTVWHNDGETCRRTVHEVGPISGYLRIGISGRPGKDAHR